MELILSISASPGHNDSLFKVLKKGYLEWRGSSFAKSHIRHFSDLCRYGFEEKEIAWQGIRAAFRAAHAKFKESKEYGLGPYERGYNSQWYSLGVSDAKDGVYRGHLCGVLAYARGWIEEVDRMKKVGWSNPDFEYEEKLIRDVLLKAGNFEAYLEERCSD